MPKVLVVDDSPIDRALIEGILKRDERMRVATAIHGADALAKLPDLQPDVIVTDLQMPEMDGLQLVTAVRFHYPRVPVVLITAHGSEDLAIRALEQGAATYVPKSQLAARLREAVDQVLTLSRSDRNYELLAERMDQAGFRFTLENDLGLADRLVELIQQMVFSMRVCDAGGKIRLGMALEEALRTAILRGNLELTEGQLQELNLRRDERSPFLEERCAAQPFVGRKVRFEAHLSLQEVRVVIEHDGPPLSFPPVAETGTPAFEAAADRSVILMRAFLDEVDFGDDGRRIAMVKRRPAGE